MTRTHGKTRSHSWSRDRSDHDRRSTVGTSKELSWSVAAADAGGDVVQNVTPELRPADE